MNTSFLEIISPKYSIYIFWDLYFSGQRNSLCSTRISNTLQTAYACSSIVFVKIRMLSRYMTTMPSAMRSCKILFIVVQKVARLLVIPKNITRGSKSPWLVQKVAFYLSLGLIHMLLKPQQMSSFKKYLAPLSQKISLDIRGREYLFLTITEFKA